MSKFMDIKKEDIESDAEITIKVEDIDPTVKICHRCSSMCLVEAEYCLTCGEPFEWFAKKLLTK